MIRKFLYCLFLSSVFFLVQGQEQKVSIPKKGGSDTLAYLSVYDLLTNRIFGEKAKIETLCSKKIKAHQLCTDLVLTDTMKAHNGMFDSFTTDLVTTTSINATNAEISHVLSDIIITNYLHAEDLNLKSLLVDLIVTNSMTALYGEIENLNTEALISNTITTNAILADLAKLELILTNTLVANFIDTEKICVDAAHIDNLCAHHIGCVEDLTADLITTNTLHVANFDVGNISLDNLVTTTIKTDNYITDLRAMVSNRADAYGYQLGTDIDFDTIVDDDNGNIVQHPTTYIVPKSGYYAITVCVKSTNVTLSSPGPLPTAEHLDVFVNGISCAQLYEEFNNARKAGCTKTILLNSLLHLNKNDIVSLRYFATRENTGSGSYEDVLGTATLVGSPLDNGTRMIVHYLSSD